MNTFKIQPILVALSEQQVAYVLVGTLGAIAHGTRLKTADVDLCIATDPENLQRVASVLCGLDARLLREPARGFAAIDLNDWASLRLDDPTEHHLFTTPYGEVDVLPQPCGTGGYGTSTNYAQLSPATVTVTAFGLQIQVAAFGDIMASKLAVARLQDQAAEPELRRIAAHLASHLPPDYGLEQFALDLEDTPFQ